MVKVLEFNGDNFSQAQADWEYRLIEKLPASRRPYILARLAMSDRHGDPNVVAKKEALEALADADENDVLEPPLNTELKTEINTWIDAYHDKEVNRDGRLPYRPAELLLAWAVDHGERPSDG